MAFNWKTHGAVDYLKSLVILGYNNSRIAELMSKKYNREFTSMSIAHAKDRYNILKYCVEYNENCRYYTDEILHLPDDDYMISCDYHSPYHSELYHNRFMCVADHLKIRKNIIVGDLVDMDCFKYWPSDDKTTFDQQIAGVAPVIESLDYFDKNILIHGNHENRVNRMTDGKIQARHLFELFGEKVWREKFEYSVFDKLYIGDKWVLLHPAAYRQNSASVALDFTIIFQRHVMNAHGHFIAMRYDRGGRYMGIDLGGMFDTRKIEYINKKTTTHPRWNNGFGVLKNGHFYHFHDNTDWEFWGAK